MDNTAGMGDKQMKTTSCVFVILFVLSLAGCVLAYIEWDSLFALRLFGISALFIPYIYCQIRITQLELVIGEINSLSIEEWKKRASRDINRKVIPPSRTFKEPDETKEQSDEEDRAALSRSREWADEYALREEVQPLQDRLHQYKVASRTLALLMAAVAAWVIVFYKVREVEEREEPTTTTPRHDVRPTTAVEINGDTVSFDGYKNFLF